MSDRQQPRARSARILWAILLTLLFGSIGQCQQMRGSAFFLFKMFDRSRQLALSPSASKELISLDPPQRLFGERYRRRFGKALSLFGTFLDIALFGGTLMRCF